MKDIGYCLYFDLIDIEKKESLRKQKIIDGEEKHIADGCEGYICNGQIKTDTSLSRFPL
jgi:hypothetical protein